MGDSKLFHILKLTRNFLFSWVNREFLIFLFFLVLSGTFWLLMVLNETYDRELDVPVQLVEIPQNVVLTSDTTTNVRITVRDKGFSLLAYIYGNKIQPVKVKFKNYAKKTGSGVLPSSELQKMITRQLFNSTQVIGMTPDKFEYFSTMA